MRDTFTEGSSLPRVEQAFQNLAQQFRLKQINISKEMSDQVVSKV